MADVVVAGGGPAGALCALLLTRAGVAVTIVERARFPRPKPCGEYLGAGFLAALERHGLGAAVRAASAPLGAVRLVTPDAQVRLPLPAGALACSRERLDAILLDAALGAGAELVLGRVRGLRRCGERIAGVVVEAAGERRELSARWTVGADGLDSTVARCAGLRRPAGGPARYAVGGHFEGFGELGTTIEMYAGRGEYLALNPLGGGAANVMLIARRDVLTGWAPDVDAGFRAAAARLSAGGRIPSRRSGPRLAVGPLGARAARAAVPGLLLVGDAAGALDPFTGQGLYLAAVSAENAAGAVVAAARARGAEREAFDRYARAGRRDLAARRRLSNGIRLLLDTPPLARRAARALERAPLAAAALTDALAGLRPPSILRLARLLA